MISKKTHPHPKRLLLAIGAAILGIASFTETAQAERPFSTWPLNNDYTDEFNGSISTSKWTKRTFGLGSINGGRPVQYYVWMADNATVGSRQCLRIKANSHGTVDKGARLDSKKTDHTWGWYEASTKIGSLNEWFWPSWWAHNDPNAANPMTDELDIMEYAWGDFGVTHWRHTSGQASEAFERKKWYKGNSSHATFMQANLVDKFTLWSVRRMSAGYITFFKDSEWLTGNWNKLAQYPMRLILSSSPNRRRAGTPNNTTFPNFYVDYMRVFKP